ncbi:MAG: hypothetical protein CL532_01570 [Aestuariivita sp.]|nr:hypothetical protein [Aestuariivita sp.]
MMSKSKTAWFKDKLTLPPPVQDLVTFAHRYPIRITLPGKGRLPEREVTFADPEVLQDAERLLRFMNNKKRRPYDHCTTW